MIPTCPASDSDCRLSGQYLEMSREALGGRTWHCPSCDHVESRDRSFPQYRQEVFLADGSPAVYPKILGNGLQMDGFIA